MSYNYTMTEDWLTDVLGDSIDMDWRYRDGARAILRALFEQNVGIPSPSGQYRSITVERLDAPPVTNQAEDVERLRAALLVILPRNINSGNTNLPDETIVPVDMTLGEIRQGLAALATSPETPQEITWRGTEDEQHEARINACCSRRTQWPALDCLRDGSCDDCWQDMAEALKVTTPPQEPSLELRVSTFIAAIADAKYSSWNAATIKEAREIMNELRSKKLPEGFATPDDFAREYQASVKARSVCRFCNGTGFQLSGWANTPSDRTCLACNKDDSDHAYWQSCKGPRS